MHDHHQRALGELALGGDVHGDGQDFFELASLPAAGAEGVVAADHHQSAAHVMHVAGQHLLLVFAEPTRAARHIRKNYRIVILHLDKVPGKTVSAGDPLQIDPLAGQCLGEQFAPAIEDAVHVQHFSLAANEGECIGRVVL